MLTFKQIKGKAIRAVAMAAALASSAVGASVVKNEAVTEHAPAPWFRYDAVAVGPIESRRAEYVALRDAMLAHPEGSIEHAALKVQMDQIPLEEKWRDGFKNLVTTVGGNSLLTEFFKGSSYTAAWYMGLIDDAGFTTVALTDTSASHAGWTEAVDYSSGTRPAITFGTAAAKSLAATAVSFAITGTTADINGAFAITNSTKGGSTGVLYSAGSFASPRAVANGDTLNVTLTVTC